MKKLLARERMKKAQKIILQVLAALAVIILIISISLHKKETSYTQEELLMDTYIKITAYGTDQKVLEEAVTKAFLSIEELEKITNRYYAPGTDEYQNSDICQLNEKAGLEEVKVSADTYEIIKKALYFGELSQGSFNIAIGPVMDLWGFGGNNKKVPEDDLLEEALKLTNLKDIALNDEQKSVFLTKPGMKLDLGGVAKGYGAAKAAEILKTEGIEKALIDAGGNIVVIGEKEPDQSWKIAIQDPSDLKKYFGVLKLTDQAAVTSGDYQRYFESEGIRYHHIIDPATGKPGNKGSSVTVVAEDSAIADILSTTLFVLGKEKAVELAAKLNMDGRFGNIEFVFIEKDGSYYVSQGLESKFTLEGNR